MPRMSQTDSSVPSRICMFESWGSYLESGFPCSYLSCAPSRPLNQCMGGCFGDGRSPLA